MCQEVSPCPLFKLAESNKALFCQPWVVSLQISAHEETSKTKYPWRDGLGLFLHWPLFHAAIRKHKIRVSATAEYTALDAQEQVPLLNTGTAFPEVFMDRKHLLSTCPQGQPITAFIWTK